MRYLKYAFLAVLAICLVTLAMANRAPVTVKLLPGDLATTAGGNASITLPLFVVIFAGIIGGIVVGFIWEWFREMKYRSQAEVEKRDRKRAEREMEKLRANVPAEPKDEVLALLETPAR